MPADQFSLIHPGTERHDAKFIAKTILTADNEFDSTHRYCNVITDQPTVVTLVKRRREVSAHTVLWLWCTSDQSSGQ